MDETNNNQKFYLVPYTHEYLLAMLDRLDKGNGKMQDLQLAVDFMDIISSKREKVIDLERNK